MQKIHGKVIQKKFEVMENVEAMINLETRQLIGSFVDALKAKRITVEKVVLYGPHASANPRADRDINLAVISPDFGKDRLKEMSMLLHAAWGIDHRIEPVAVSSASYARDTSISLISEIRQKGIEVEAA